MTLGKTSASVLALFALAACGGSGDSGVIVIDADEQGLRVFADADGDGDPDQDIADVLVDGDLGVPGNGTTLTARKVSTSGWSEAFPTLEDDDGSYTAFEGQVQFEGDGKDLLVHFLEPGETELTTFRVVDASSIDSNVVEIEIGDNGFFFLGVFGGGEGGTIADLLNADADAGVFRNSRVFYLDDGAETTTEYDIAIGVETRDEYLDELQLAETVLEYSGGSFLQIQGADFGYDTFTTEVRGDVSLTADFGQGVVSGALSNLNIQGYDNRNLVPEFNFDPDGSILLDETAIQANAFRGSMTADDDLLLSAPEASGVVSAFEYSGAFYGDDAGSVGGVFSGTANDGTDDFLALGSWGAGLDR